MTRDFPGLDIGSDHDLVMMMKTVEKTTQDPDAANTFQTNKGGKLAPLIGPRADDIGIDTMITSYNTAVTDAASEI